MIDNPYRAPGSSLDATPSLGPALVSCRDRSEKERLAAMSQNMFTFFLLRSGASIVAAAYLMGAVAMLGFKPSVQVARVIFGSICLAACGGIYWQMMRRPSKPSLVLHESGFRFKKRSVRFEELASIRFGGKPSRLLSVALAANRAFGRISPANATGADLLEKGLTGSLTLVFEGGKEEVLGGILIRPLPEDLERFLDRLRSIRPGLLDETSAPPSHPGLDDLPFRMTQL